MGHVLFNFISLCSTLIVKFCPTVQECHSSEITAVKLHFIIFTFHFVTTLRSNFNVGSSKKIMLPANEATSF